MGRGGGRKGVTMRRRRGSDAPAMRSGAGVNAVWMGLGVLLAVGPLTEVPAGRGRRGSTTSPRRPGRGRTRPMGWNGRFFVRCWVCGVGCSRFAASCAARRGRRRSTRTSSAQLAQSSRRGDFQRGTSNGGNTRRAARSGPFGSLALTGKVGRQIGPRMQAQKDLAPGATAQAATPGRTLIRNLGLASSTRPCEPLRVVQSHETSSFSSTP